MEERLLDFVSALPLPVVAWRRDASSAEDLASPVVVNQPLKELLRGLEMSSCLTKESSSRLRRLIAGDEDQKINLALQVHDAHLHVQFKVHRAPPLVILTAIPVSSSFDRSPRSSTGTATIIGAVNGRKISLPSPDCRDVWRAAPDSLPPPTSSAPIFSLRNSPMTRQHFARLASDAPIGLFFCNLQLEVIWVNDRWVELVGLSPNDDPNSWPARIFPPDKDRVVAYAQRMVAELLPMELEFRWVSTDDVESWCVNNMVVARNEDGAAIGIIGTLYNVHKAKSKELQDLRERHRERESLLGLERDLAIMSKLSSVGLSRMDLDGHVLEVNEAWWGIVKLPRDRPLDDWRSLVHPDEKEAKQKLWQDILKNKAQTSELTVRWCDDSVSLVQVHPNHPTNSTGWVCSLTDITSKARAEEALLSLAAEREAHARKAAEEAEARKEDVMEEKRQQELYIDVAMHEMRNPISGILQNAEMTKGSLEDLRRAFAKLEQAGQLPSVFSPRVVEELDEDIEAVESIHSCGLAQERIANDILGLAQIQLSKFKISPVEFDLPQSLRNIVRIFKTEARSKGIEVVLELGKSIARLGPHARVLADPARLSQICINLLSNAIRFTHRAPIRVITLGVEVSAQPPNRAGPFVPPDQTEYQVDKSVPVYLFIAVKDTGSGMSADEQAQLFSEKPFFYSSGGTGLGLWIVRNLCQLQAGGIEVESELGKGSTFRAFITARSVDAGLPPEESAAFVPVIEGIKNPAGQGSSPKTVLSSGFEVLPLRGMTILCCEDNAINRKVLERQLKKAGAAQVLLAFDGQEGLNALEEDKERNIDCCIMDVEMPVMDGLTATRTIRDQEQKLGLPHLRIVGLSGNARGAQVQAGLDAGMDSFVTKPYRVPDLVRKLLGEEDDPTAEPSETPTPFITT